MDFLEPDHAPLYRPPAVRWDESDFEDIEKLYTEKAEDYASLSQSESKGKGFLICLHNLHDLRAKIVKTGGGLVDDRHFLQLLYLERGVQALQSTYHLVKNHCYSACYGRIRFFLELYLVVRELNRDKEKARKTYHRVVKDLKENDYEPHEETYLTQFFKGKRKQLRGRVYQSTQTVRQNIRSNQRHRCSPRFN